MSDRVGITLFAVIVCGFVGYTLLQSRKAEALRERLEAIEAPRRPEVNWLYGQDMNRDWVIGLKDDGTVVWKPRQ